MKKIGVNDPRLNVGPDGGKPQKDPQAYTVRRAGPVAYFKVGELRPGVPHESPVQVIGTEFVFFPERSSAHKAILASIGEDV